MPSFRAAADLAAAYDGPEPPAALAAARWGADAWERLARCADAALIEARLREILDVLGRLRRWTASNVGGEGGVRARADLQRLAHAIAEYRVAALAL